MYSTRTTQPLLFAILFAWLANAGLIAQQNDSKAIASIYQSARTHYAERQFQKSADEFHAAAELCPGSELAVQCEYFSAMSEWAIEPSDSGAAKLARWLNQAANFERDALASGRSFGSKQLLQWIKNAELVHAKWDRLNKRTDLAEKRLRTSLGQTATAIVTSEGNPHAWLELGLLLLEDRHDFANAETCFENAMGSAGPADRSYCQSKIGQVKYEFAMAMSGAGETSKAEALLSQIVQFSPDSRASIDARLRLARNAVDKKKWQEVADWADQAIRLGCSPELTPYAYLLHGMAQFELGAHESSLADFKNALTNTIPDLNLEVSIRFQLAETLYQLQRWPEAESHWQWLRQIGQRSEDSSAKPDWYPVVLLHLAELLALRKEWDQAEQIVLRIRNDFPKCNRACEVDYLLARCLVSKADFDAARQVLKSVIERANPTPDELVARSYWMIGETYLMQRSYADALVAYREAKKIPNQKYWSSASLIQIAKCCEAMQDIQGAREAYECIAVDFADSPFAGAANERLTALPPISVANQSSKEPKSGTKR